MDHKPNRSQSIVDLVNSHIDIPRTGLLADRYDNTPPDHTGHPTVMAVASVARPPGVHTRPLWASRTGHTWWI